MARQQYASAVWGCIIRQHSREALIKVLGLETVEKAIDVYLAQGDSAAAAAERIISEYDSARD